MDLQIFESDDEDEFIEMIPRRRHPKIFKYRPNYFEELDELDFFMRFRLQKHTCLLLLGRIEDTIKSPTMRNNALSPSTKMLLTLRFYATGSMLLAMGDFVGVSKSSACVAVKKVTNAIASLHNEFIVFPRTEYDRQETKRRFYEVARFPHVIGTIDCTHIRIQSPGGDQAERFRNRKGFFSWNVQTVCDSKLQIMDIVIRWPGSSHDQTIFNNSRLKARLEVNDLGMNSLLLGDSGYALSRYLITPLLNPNTAVEHLFNESQIRTRNCVERLYGVWKRRFPILCLGMRVCLERSQAIIAATAVLHNLAITENDGDPPVEFEIIEENIPVLQQEDNHGNVVNDNHRVRLSLINNHFANLL